MNLYDHSPDTLNSFLRENYLHGKNIEHGIPIVNPYKITSDTVFLLKLNNTRTDECGNIWTFSVPQTFAATPLPPISGITHVLNYSTFNNSYVECTSLAGNAIGTGDFTVDFWAYTSGQTATYYPFSCIGHYNGSLVNRFGSVFYYNGYGLWYEHIKTKNLNHWRMLSGWHHYAIVRRSGVGYLYRDGIELEQIADYTFSALSGFSFGAYGTTILEPVLLSHYRLSRTALWNANFVPPGVNVQGKEYAPTKFGMSYRNGSTANEVWCVEYSDDNLNWSLAAGRFKPNQLGWNYATCPNYGNKKYWRFRVETQSSGEYLNEISIGNGQKKQSVINKRDDKRGPWKAFKIVGLSQPRLRDVYYIICHEMQWIESSGGTNQCSGGTPFASSMDPVYPIKNAFDSNISTYWLTNSSPWQSVITAGYILSTPKKLYSIKLHSDGYFNMNWKNFSIYGSNDTTNGTDGTWYLLLDNQTTSSTVAEWSEHIIPEIIESLTVDFTYSLSTDWITSNISGTLANLIDGTTGTQAVCYNQPVNTHITFDFSQQIFPTEATFAEWSKLKHTNKLKYWWPLNDKPDEVIQYLRCIVHGTVPFDPDYGAQFSNETCITTDIVSMPTKLTLLWWMRPDSTMFNSGNITDPIGAPSGSATTGYHWGPRYEAAGNLVQFNGGTTWPTNSSEFNTTNYPTTRLTLCALVLNRNGSSSTVSYYRANSTNTAMVQVGSTTAYADATPRTLFSIGMSERLAVNLVDQVKHFNGYIRDVRIYERILSLADIELIRAAGPVNDFISETEEPLDSYKCIKFLGTYNTTNDGCGMNEIEILPTVGGSDQCEGGTILSGGDAPSYGKEYAFDNLIGSPTQVWDGPNSGTSAWIAYKKDAGITPKVVRFYGENWGNPTRFQFKNMQILGSNNTTNGTDGNWEILGNTGKVYHQVWKNYTIIKRKTLAFSFDSFLIHKWLLTNNGNDAIGNWNFVNNGAVSFGSDGAVFSGSNYLNLASITLPTAFTICGWVKVNTSATYNNMFGLVDSREMTYAFENGLARHQCCGIEVNTTGTITLSNWTFIAMGTNGTNLTFKFFNGSYWSSTSVGATRTYSNWQVGRGFWAANDYLRGNVKDLRIYSSCLTSDNLIQILLAGPSLN